MTQEDKDFLYTDLCARLPYGVHYNHVAWDEELGEVEISVKIHSVNHDGYVRNCYDDETIYIDRVKPYLFPLSSMTEKQQEEFDIIYADDMQVVANNLKNRLDGKPYETNLGHYRHIDWLNANHFDYRGLIPKGLAIDATGLNIY